MPVTVSHRWQHDSGFDVAVVADRSSLPAEKSRQTNRQECHKPPAVFQTLEAPAEPADIMAMTVVQYRYRVRQSARHDQACAAF